MPAHNGVPGKLIAVEGLDGSGKSTQIYLLKRWLELEGYKIFFTEWNSSGPLLPAVVLPDFHHKSNMEMPSSIAVATRETIRPALSSSSLNCGMALIALDMERPSEAAIESGSGNSTTTRSGPTLRSFSMRR